MSHMRSIVTLLVSFAFMGLFSLLSRGTRLQQSRLEQSTYKVSGRIIGEPAILSARIGGDLLLRLTRIPRQEEPPIILYARVNRDGSVEIPNVPPGTYRLEATPAAAALRTQQVREADGFSDMRIVKSEKLMVSLTCESASPGS